MPADPGLATRVQLLLDELFLSSEAYDSDVLGRVPLQWIAEWLGLGLSDYFGDEVIRHLVAIHLAPREAVAYDEARPEPKWKLIARYLQERFSLSDEECEPLARVTASILDAAASRERGASLIAPDTARQCRLCRLSFVSEPTSVATKDPFKPTWQAQEELCRPEVDHIVPISGLGEHSISNVHVICRACNLAKGGGLVVNPDAEIRYAACTVDQIPRIHLFRLLQLLIVREDGECQSCGTAVGELTMRPVHPSAPIARGTLRLTCYECLAGP